MRHRIIARTRTDILRQIIEVAKEKPVTKTRIAYDCFLSYDFLNACLDTLVECDLLKFDEQNKKYSATKKGLHYAELYAKLERYVESNK